MPTRARETNHAGRIPRASENPEKSGPREILKARAAAARGSSARPRALPTADEPDTHPKSQGV
jgi:hypothetical protein